MKNSVSKISCRYFFSFIAIFFALFFVSPSVKASGSALETIRSVASASASAVKSHIKATASAMESSLSGVSVMFLGAVILAVVTYQGEFPSWISIPMLGAFTFYWGGRVLYFFVNLFRQESFSGAFGILLSIPVSYIAFTAGVAICILTALAIYPWLRDQCAPALRSAWDTSLEYMSRFKAWCSGMFSIPDILNFFYNGYVASWGTWVWNGISGSISYCIPDFGKEVYTETLEPTVNWLLPIEPEKEEEKEVKETPEEIRQRELNEISELSNKEEPKERPVLPWVVGLLVAISLLLYLRNGGA